MSATATRPETGFHSFGLDEVILKGIESAGFTEPRPIQQAAIAEAAAGRDVLGLAQTGTGKTAAFALPTLHRMIQSKRRGPRTLVLAPTRELATQIAEETRELARFTGLKTVCIYGGVSQRNQEHALKRQPEFIVGCPGRVLDLIQQRVLDVRDIETLVLDEADHMFDMGFFPTIRKILAELPKQRQNLLFSATMPSEIRRLADAVLHNPHVVELTSTQPAATIEHALIAVAEGRKRPLIERILERDDCKSAIVFTRTKHRARRLAEQLYKGGVEATALQGNMSQNARDRAMKGFRNGQFDVLVATDIVARGIDVHGVSYVINYDVPNTSEAYTHRIGRTGRGDLEGMALTFLTSDDDKWLRATEKTLGKAIDRATEPGFDAGWVESESRRDNRRDDRDGDRDNRGPRRKRSSSGSRSGRGRSRVGTSSGGGDSWGSRESREPRGEGGGGEGNRGGGPNPRGKKKPSGAQRRANKRKRQGSPSRGRD